MFQTSGRCKGSGLLTGDLSSGFMALSLECRSSDTGPGMGAGLRVRV